jgi:glutamate/tyrosine decarboxylase-like PLP-dependent enzyme
MAPVVLNIVCFRNCPTKVPEGERNKFNEELLVRLHESGVAAPSYTTLGGRYCLRAALCNHRTRSSDLALMMDAVVKIGAELAAGGV